MSTLRWATVTALVLTAGSTAAEEIVVDDGVYGFAGIGEAYTLAEDHFFWVGEFSGSAVYPGAGPLETMALQCPGWFEIDLSANTQRGGGFCTAIVPGGGTFVHRWACEGTADPYVCDGPIEVIEGSGTGELEGLAGTGTIRATADVAHANGISSSYTMVDWTLTLP